MLLQPITVPFSKSTLKPSVYTLSSKGDMIRSVYVSSILTSTNAQRSRPSKNFAPTFARPKLTILGGRQSKHC